MRDSGHLIFLRKRQQPLRTRDADRAEPDGVSIHAPLTGCDSRLLALLACTVAFQSTHPSRGATPHRLCPQKPCSYFNPRTPHGVRLHTAFSKFRPWYFNPRTPHGVRPFGHHTERQRSYFNPRTPHGVRLVILGPALGIGPFQSTHPSRGATDLVNRYKTIQDISIHAPLTGCDP